MLEILQQWYHRHFTDPQTVIFAFILIVGTLLVFVLNAHLMPILIAIIIAYLAEGMVIRLRQVNIGRAITADIACPEAFDCVHQGVPDQNLAKLCRH